MLTALFSLWSLLAPLTYAVLMVIVWANTPQRRTRYALLAAMSLLPTGYGFNAAWQLQAVNAAESQFDSSCVALEKPVINATAQNVASIFFDLRPPQDASPDAARHAALALPANELSQAILQGATRYTKIEYQQDRIPLRTIEANSRSRTITSGAALSSHTVVWKSINASSEFVTKGTLVIRERASDTLLAELPLAQLHSPAVTLFGDGRRSLHLLEEKNITCPGTRAIAQFIKAVARPTQTRAD